MATESITRIDNGKQTLVLDKLTYGQALGYLWSMRSYVNKLRATHPEMANVYYRLGVPHD